MPPPSKRQKTDLTKVEEITFDIAARQDYLTGFHKRKLQRAKHAKEIAEKKARAERIEQRRKACLLPKLREERKEDLERHVAEVNALLKPLEPASEEASSASECDNGGEWNSVVELLEVDHEAQYVDEDRYTTVTVEAMDLSKDGLHKAENEAEDDLDRSKNVKPEGAPISPSQRRGKRTWTKEKPEKEGHVSKRKRKKFRYENKAARKMTRIKEKSKNGRQATARRSG